MANISDYLDWRADVPFSLDPFNEVDNLVLCELVYSAFDGIVEGPDLKKKISIEEVCSKFFEKYTDEELMAKNTMTKVAPFLLRKMANSNRFGGTKLSGYINEIDESSQSQFAACTFYLPDGTIYAAFRGTDDTLVGWREDFNMCFSSATGGQKKAVDYLNQNFSRTMKKIRVGGHSKGGNFAVYASAFCKPSVKDSILEVYSNDGPGFIDEILEKEEYLSIVKKIKSFIPEQSIVGLLMGNCFNSSIVVSDAKGINQHDPMSWQIKRNSFERAEKLADSSLVIDEVIKKWTVQFDYETRNLFGDILFSSFASSGATKLSEVTSGGVKSVAAISKDIQSLDKEQQELFYEVVKSLVASGGEVFKNTLLEKIPYPGKNKKK